MQAECTRGCSMQTIIHSDIQRLPHIDEAEKLGLTSFYIEIIVKEGFRAVKALDEDEDEDDFDEE